MATNNVLIQKYTRSATGGYNQINPLTVDEDLNTRIGFASGSTSKDIIDYNSQFWWKRRTESSIFKKTETVLSFDKNELESTCFATWAYSSENQDYITINYSDTIDFDANTGKITLKNPSSLRFQRIAYGNASVKATGCEDLIGKYVERVVNGEVNGEICYLPKVYQNNTNAYIQQYWSGASGQPYALYLPYGGETLLGSVSVLVYNWELVSANSQSSYPNIGEQGSYYYEYLGNPLKDWKSMAKIDQGTYIGTGSSTLTLAFEFQPKFLVVTTIAGSYGTSAAALQGGAIYAVNDTTSYQPFYRPQYTSGSYMGNAVVIGLTWVENGVQITNVSGLNATGVEYVYVAFG